MLAAPKSFTVIAKSESEKKDWVKTIQENTKDFNCTTGSKKAAVWSADHESKECQACAKAFNLFIRRHHCRQCGALVCGKCSKNSMILPHIHDKKKLRVCDKCFAGPAKASRPSFGGASPRMASESDESSDDTVDEDD